MISARAAMWSGRENVEVSWARGLGDDTAGCYLSVWVVLIVDPKRARDGRKGGKLLNEQEDEDGTKIVRELESVSTGDAVIRTVVHGVDWDGRRCSGAIVSCQGRKKGKKKNGRSRNGNGRRVCGFGEAHRSVSQSGCAACGTVPYPAPQYTAAQTVYLNSPGMVLGGCGLGWSGRSLFSGKKRKKKKTREGTCGRRHQPCTLPSHSNFLSSTLQGTRVWDNVPQVERVPCGSLAVKYLWVRSRVHWGSLARKLLSGPSGMGWAGRQRGEQGS